MVQSCKENKPDPEDFMGIVPSTSVDTVIADCGSVEIPSELCETLNLSHAESRRK